MLTAARGELKASCARVLSHRRPRTQAQWLAELAAVAEPIAFDQYGSGEPVATLEHRVAALLGKPAALFVSKGVIAQLIALRIHTSRRGVPVVALHPQSHLEIDEGDAYRRVHGLAGVRLGRDGVPFTAADLTAVPEPLGCVTVEVPLRRGGYVATPWDELGAISAWCRAHGIPLHLDGARVWETAPYYGQTLAGIGALADSIYVSLYKGLGGLGGCVLAGTEAFIAEARLWQVRLGGVLPAAFPLALSALAGLDRELPRMQAYYERAREFARALAAVPGALVTPAPPHGNAFVVFLAGEVAALERARDAVAREQGLWLGDAFVPTVVPGWSKLEITIGGAAGDWSDAEGTRGFAELIERAATNTEG